MIVLLKIGQWECDNIVVINRRSVRMFVLYSCFQGDVGSGKTVIAFLCMLSVVERGRQAALMAPTEVLAEQHAVFFKRMIDDMQAQCQDASKIKVGNDECDDD